MFTNILQEKSTELLVLQMRGKKVHQREKNTAHMLSHTRSSSIIKKKCIKNHEQRNNPHILSNLKEQMASHVFRLLQHFL